MSDSPNFSALVGKVVSFYPRPECVVLCLPAKDAKRFVGQVTAAWDGGTVRGNIPDTRLRVRGRTGREAEISLVEHYVSFHAGWKEAETSIQ